MGDIDFKKSFKTFGSATPDGNLPKINAFEGDGKGGGGKDGVYDLEVVSTDMFQSFEGNKTWSFKMVVNVLSCDNGRFRPGTQASIVVHKILDSHGGTEGLQPWELEKSWGNMKALVAAAVNSRLQMDVSPYDDDCGGSPWWEMLENCKEIPETLTGGRIRVQVTTAKAQKSGHNFAKMSVSPIPLSKAA